jgi:hypothetical protein
MFGGHERAPDVGTEAGGRRLMKLSSFCMSLLLSY